VCVVDRWLRLQLLGLVEVYRLSLIALVMEQYTPLKRRSISTRLDAGMPRWLSSEPELSLRPCCQLSTVVVVVLGWDFVPRYCIRTPSFVAPTIITLLTPTQCFV
jgi:hypothetical protein